jgi:hypothetical protein
MSNELEFQYITGKNKELQNLVADIYLDAGNGHGQEVVDKLRKLIKTAEAMREVVKTIEGVR